MATDLEKLVVQLSADIKGYEREMRKARGITDRETRAMTDRWKKQNAEMKRVAESSARQMSTVFKGVGAGLAGVFGAQQIARFADGSTRITNALKVAGLEGKNLTDTYDRLGKIALDNGAGFEALATLYAKVTQSSKELGISTRDVEEFTRRMAVGLRASGTDARQASAGIMQLNQALASGVLRGDEFNSVAENLPVVAKAIADGFGVSVGKLRQMAADGELTAKAVFGAFMRGSQGLDAQAAKTSSTFSQAFENINTALTIAVGKFNETTGASQLFADAITKVVAPAIISLGEAIDATNKRHREAAVELEQYSRALGIHDAAANAIAALKDLGREADPLVQAFQTAQREVSHARNVVAAELSGLTDDYFEAMQSLKAAGQEDVASSLSVAFVKLTTKIAFGRAEAADFDAVIAGLANTGDASADRVAGQLELIQAKFAETGAKAKQSFDTAGQALADALGANAIAIVDALAARIGSAMPEAVGRFTSALREALGLLAQADVATATVTGQLKAFSSFKLGELNTNADGSTFDLNRRVQLLNARDQIKRQESAGSGGYRALGPIIPKTGDRAYGAYQVMGNNIGPWSQQVLGTRLTAEQFLNNPDFQDKIFDSIFGGYLDKYGAEGAGRAWFAGERGMHNSGGTDPLGTSVGDYGKRFAEGMEPLKDAWDGLREDSIEPATEAVRDQETAYDQLGQVGMTALRGLGNALRDGKITGEELLGILIDVVEQLINMPNLNFGALGGGGSGGFLGFLGGLFGGGGVDPWAGLRLAGGGRVRGPGGPTGDKIPAMLSDGEHVTRAAMAKKYGPLLDAINADRLPRFADGTPPRISLPSMAGVASRGSGAAFTLAPSYSIDARGSQMSEGQFKAILEQNNKQLMGQVHKSLPSFIRDHRQRGRAV